MTGVEPVPDAVFFREWDARSAGQRRSLARARSVRELAGLAGYRPAVLTVVGSKGKGTTATYASGWLAAAGHSVVTVTSPSLRASTERIRVDGTAVAGPTLARLGQRLAAAIRRLPPGAGPDPGYLSPSGLFTLAGLLLAAERSADYLVLEAGRGGRSDEVSLLAATVVAVTPIFAEHLAQLGGSPAAVVTDKLGVVGPATRAVVVARQPDQPTWRRVRAAVAARTAGRLAAEPLPAERLAAGPLPAGRLAAGPPPAERLPDTVPDLPDRLLPPGLGRANARLGCLAAARLLAVTSRPAPPAPAVAATLASVRLPGRLSVHELPGTRTRVVVDMAVNAPGFHAAVRYARSVLGGIDHVLLSLPDDKDWAGAVAALAGLPVTMVPVPASHLRYTRHRPAGWRVHPARGLDRAHLSGLGDRLLALGTVSFAGLVLALLEVPTAVAFRAPAATPADAPERPIRVSRPVR